MARFFNDPLLSLTRTYLGIAYRACFALAGICGAILLILLAPALASGRFDAGSAHGALFALKAAPYLAILGWFIRLLRQIVNGVAEGNPFVAANADRLSRMGWLWLLLTAIGLVERLLLLRWPLATSPPATFNAPAHGLLIALTLFILARVFRVGAAMREDLEGTV